MGVICRCRKECEVNENQEVVGGVVCPIDPMDLLQCDSCQ
jgi:hypothetical protein